MEETKTTVTFTGDAPHYERSGSIKELASALAKFQGSINNVKKDNEVDFTSAKGRTKYSYAGLDSIIDAIREPLAKNGLSLTQFPGTNYSLTSILMHESGEYILTTYTMKAPAGEVKPQDYGSLITYARRYALSALLGIATEEDDDGKKANDVGSGAKAPAKAPATKAPTVDAYALSKAKLEEKNTVEAVEKWIAQVEKYDSFTVEQKEELLGLGKAKVESLSTGTDTTE